MTDTEALARIIISTACCAAIIIASAASFLSNSTQAIALDGGFEIANPSYEETPSQNTPSNSNTESQPNESSPDKENSSAASESSAVETATDGNVQGAVIEKFISPYTANTSYNGVYLKNSTDLAVDIKALLSSPLGFKISKSDEPQVLILHTHATETFLYSEKDHYTDKDVTRTTDDSKNMVYIGKIITDALNSAGIKTVHATTQHDYPEYNNSYSRAAKTINSYLKKHPDIKVVIDLHRDAVASGDTDKVKLTTEINGKKAAQIMLVMGSQSGGVTNFPNWQENLKLAVRLQQTVEVMYPTLARALSLTSKNYNESLTSGSMLIEIGTDGNTLDEAKYSAELLSHALISLFNTLE